MVQANVTLAKKVEEILQDEDTKQWILTLGSESSQTNYPKHLAEYLLHRNISISELIASFKQDGLQETKHLQAFLNHMIEKLAESSVANYLSAVKSRLQYDGLRLARDIKIKNRHQHHTVESQTVPTKDQIITFLQTAKPSTQVIIAFGAFLGFRFKVMSDLRVSDFPEMRITEDGKIIFEKMPTRIKVRSELSKNRKAYQTFLIEFGCKLLQNYLEIRMRDGEKLEPNSLILPTEGGNESQRYRAKALARRLYTVFVKLGYESRPYSLKDFFATALANSGLQQNYQTFFMGHTGPMQNEYSVRRQQPSDQIEFMRNIFKKDIEPYLVPQPNSADKTMKEGFKKLANAMGLEVKEDATTDETIEEIASLYTSAKDDLASRMPTKPSISTKQQKRVTEDVLDNYLEEGWEVVSTLQSGSIVIQKVS